MIVPRLLPLLLVVCLGGCVTEPGDIGREPMLTPVGAGIYQPAVDLRMPPKLHQASYARGSLWSDSAADLFRDQRAMKIGDIVTVRISIRDRAKLNNSSDRSRSSTNDLGVNFDYDLLTPGIAVAGTGTLNTGVAADTEHKGKGGINRSEQIELLIAAFVADVLPNGTLFISGSQEVRVNFEVRILTISGILHPRDIGPDNIVSYDRIAEARIAYGGRGRLTEVQQPGWGHQIVDLLAPF